jgi:hypothetical protein
MTARRYLADITDPTTGQSSQIVSSNQNDLDAVIDELYPPIDPNELNSADSSDNAETKQPRPDEPCNHCADTADIAEPSYPGRAAR